MCVGTSEPRVTQAPAMFKLPVLKHKDVSLGQCMHTSVNICLGVAKNLGLVTKIWSDLMISLTMIDTETDDNELV